MKLGQWVLLVLLSTLPLASMAQTPSLTICKGSSINYKEFNEPGSLPSVAWKWTFGGANPPSSTAREPQNINYPDTGLFYTECESTFSDGSKSTKGVYVLVVHNAFDPIPIRDTAFCSNPTRMTLNAANPYRGYRYHWTSTDVNLGGMDTTARTLNIDKPGTYSVKVYSICGSSSKTAVVKMGEIPSVDLGKDRFVCRNVLVTLDAGSNSSYSYRWFPNGETSSSITANLAGTYRVEVRSIDGCMRSDEVNLIDSCPPLAWLPTAFSPDANNRNDIYLPYLEGFKEMDMKIYNRWGEKVYETQTFGDGWDGYSKGKPAQEGVYIVLLEVIGNDNYRKVMKGNFTLLR
jgi:gliding motility-associated-like protein